MARVSVILAVILSLFVLSHARLSTEPTVAAAAAAATTSSEFVLSHARLSTEPTAAAATTITSSEISTDADREPSETLALDQTVHFVPINEIGDGSLPTEDVFRHIEFSLRRPIYHHGHHFRHFRGHRRHRMRAMEIALGADAIGLPGDRFPLRSSEEKGLVKEGEAEEIKREKPMEEEEEIEKREDDSDSDSDDDAEDKVEKMEKRKRKGDCKKNKKHHHLHRFLRHPHHRHEPDEAEKIGFMKRFWDFLNHF